MSEGSDDMSIGEQIKIRENTDTDKNRTVSQSEQEHFTYLAVYKKYEEYNKKRFLYRKACLAVIILSLIMFILLALSNAMKIIALILWVVIIISCISVMIAADHRYDTYKEMLGLKDELDDEFEDDGEEGEPPEI